MHEHYVSKKLMTSLSGRGMSQLLMKSKKNISKTGLNSVERDKQKLHFASTDSLEVPN